MTPNTPNTTDSEPTSTGTDSEQTSTGTSNTAAMTADDTTTTAEQTRTETAQNRTDGATMGGVDQTHPDTNQPFGFTVYGRGVAADGGREQEDESMEDVDHESDTGGSNRTFERGKDSGDE